LCAHETATKTWRSAHPRSFPLPQLLHRPPWFRALVWMEVALQLPFFVYAMAAFWRRDHRVRMLAAAYGVSTATTLVPILAELAAAAPPEHRTTLISFYAPYLVVPLGIGWWMLTAKGDPFGGKAAKAKKRR